MVELSIRQRLSLPVTPGLYKEIRHLWIAHSRAEDARSLRPRQSSTLSLSRVSRRIVLWASLGSSQKEGSTACCSSSAISDSFAGRSKTDEHRFDPLEHLRNLRS